MDRKKHNKFWNKFLYAGMPFIIFNLIFFAMSIITQDISGWSMGFSYLVTAIIGNIIVFLMWQYINWLSLDHDYEEDSYY